MLSIRTWPHSQTNMHSGRWSQNEDSDEPFLAQVSLFSTVFQPPHQAGERESTVIPVQGQALTDPVKEHVATGLPNSNTPSAH